MTEYSVRKAEVKDIETAETAFLQMGWPKPNGYFNKLIRLQQKGDLVFLVAVTNQGEYAGHLKLVWKPEYPHFRKLEIPEIQDLNVLPRFRRNGVATMLVNEAEKMAREKTSQVGIGFGLYADYGPAQRMYVKRGYIPDGNGIAIHNEKVNPGQMVSVNDSLVLFLVKDL